MKVNINVKSDKAKIKYYDIESISEFLSKIKGSIRRVKIAIDVLYEGYMRLKKNSSIIYTSNKLYDGDNIVVVDTYCNIGDKFSVELRSVNGATVYLRYIRFYINTNNYITL